jgi:hypothetical protein
MRKRILLLVTALVMALMMAFGGMSFAKISSVNTSCSSNGTNPPGQQPTCQGGGLTQNTENQNPSGHAPPGQNP